MSFHHELDSHCPRCSGDKPKRQFYETATRDIYPLSYASSKQVGLIPSRQSDLAAGTGISALGGGIPAHTCAGRGVWLPEKSVLDLHASDFGLSLQRVSWITLEDDGVTGLFAVAAPAPVLGNPRVIAGSGSRN